MSTPAELTLVIFTCEGREHLIMQSFQSFMQHCDVSFSRVILAIDGQVADAVPKAIKPDTIVQSFERKGYVQNIIAATRQINTDYFFWLEDDFLFHKKVPLQYMLNTMLARPDWAGIFLSRSAPLNDNEKQVHLFDDFYVPHFGYSASPALCNTKHIKAAVAALIALPKTEDTVLYSFETFFDDYFKQNHLPYAMPDPGDTVPVSHVGLLESTARQFIMVNSIDAKQTTYNKEYISGLGASREISFKNKLGIFFKLWRATLSLSIKMWSFREAYDFAFRIYRASLRNFKT
jgi:hypothetical protein